MKYTDPNILIDHLSARCAQPNTTYLMLLEAGSTAGLCCGAVLQGVIYYIHHHPAQTLNQTHRSLLKIAFR
jgi:hypothetical protein